MRIVSASFNPKYTPSVSRLLSLEPGDYSLVTLEAHLPNVARLVKVFMDLFKVGAEENIFTVSRKSGGETVIYGPSLFQKDGKAVIEFGSNSLVLDRVKKEFTISGEPMPEEFDARLENVSGEPWLSLVLSYMVDEETALLLVMPIRTQEGVTSQQLSNAFLAKDFSKFSELLRPRAEGQKSDMAIKKHQLPIGVEFPIIRTFSKPSANGEFLSQGVTIKTTEPTHFYDVERKTTEEVPAGMYVTVFMKDSLLSCNPDVSEENPGYLTLLSTKQGKKGWMANTSLRFPSYGVTDDDLSW